MEKEILIKNLKKSALPLLLDMTKRDFSLQIADDITSYSRNSNGKIIIKEGQKEGDFCLVFNNETSFLNSFTKQKFSLCEIKGIGIFEKGRIKKQIEKITDIIAKKDLLSSDEDFFLLYLLRSFGTMYENGEKLASFFAPNRTERAVVFLSVNQKYNLIFTRGRSLVTLGEYDRAMPYAAFSAENFISVLSKMSLTVAVERGLIKAFAKKDCIKDYSDAIEYLFSDFTKEG